MGEGGGEIEGGVEWERGGMRDGRGVYQRGGGVCEGVGVKGCVWVCVKGCVWVCVKGCGCGCARREVKQRV